MGRKRLLTGTAAFIFAAVLLSTQLSCQAASGLQVARKAVFEALEKLFTVEEPLTASERDVSLLEDCCVIGHSHAVGMQMTLDVEELDYIAEVGLMAESMLYHPDFVLPDGGRGGLRRGLEAKSYERIFVLLGTNDMIGGASYLPVFKTSMETLLDTLEELQPEAEIYMLSIAPLGKGFKEFCYYNYGLTQEVMDEFNYSLRSLALSRDVELLNITDALSDESGHLAAEYDRGDGLHFNLDGNLVILDTMLAYLEA